MSRRIQEGNGAAVDFDRIGADMLGDAAGLAGGDIRMADIVEQRSLAVVDMAHDHHHRCAGDQIFFLVGRSVDEALLHRHDDFLLDLAAELHGHESSCIVVDHIGDRGENAGLNELLDHFGRGLLHPHGQIADRDLVGNLDRNGLLACNLPLQAVHLVALFLTTFAGGLLLRALLRLLIDLFLIGRSAAVAKLLVVAGLGAGHILEFFVIFFDIHRRAAAGIDHALLCHLSGRVGLITGGVSAACAILILALVLILPAALSLPLLGILAGAILVLILSAL